MTKITLRLGSKKVPVETDRFLQRGQPNTVTDSGGTLNGYSWQGQELDRGELRKVKEIREKGGLVSWLFEAKALMKFGTGAELQSENDDLQEWLNDEFENLDLTVLDLGSDGIWYPYGLGEVVETRGGEFSHIECIEPWTMLPRTDEYGTIQAWEQETQNNRTDLFQPEEIGSIVLNKSSGRDKVGVSEVLRSEEEITQYKENQRAVNKAIEIAGFPHHVWTVGAEGRSPVDDNDLRRVRNLIDNMDGDTQFVVGPDVDHDKITAADFAFEDVTKRDLRILTTTIGLPMEVAGYGREGMGSGSEAALIKDMLALQNEVSRRRFETQFVDEFVRPVVNQYSPYNAENEQINMQINPFLDERDDVADLISKIGEYMTTQEVRDKLDLPPVEDDEIAESYRSPESVEEAEEEPDDAGGDGLFFSDGRQIQSVPDNAIPIDSPSDAPEDAQVIEGPRGGTYAVPEGEGSADEDTGNGDATVDPTNDEGESMIAETPDELPDEMNPNNAVGTEDFEATGVGGAQNFTIARMPDEQDDLLVKEGVDAGEAQATSATSMRIINEESAPETAYVESEDVVVQKLAGEGTVEEVPADTESFTSTFATTALIGDADPNANNFVVDDNGDVSNVDSEGVVDISQDWATDSINTEIDNMYVDMGYNSPEEAREAINDSIQEQAESVDVDELRDVLPNTWMGNQIYENVQSVKEEPRILSDGGSGNLNLVNDDTPDFDRHYLSMLEGHAWAEDTGRSLVGFSDGQVPDMVVERMRDTILGGAMFSDFETIPSSDLMALREVFADKLTSDGWTTDELKDSILELEPDLEDYEAERIARSETQHLVNEARESAYLDRGLEDDTFKWLGTEDHRTTEVCTWLKEQTNPKHGGNPVTLERMKELIQEGNDKFVDHDARDYSPHIQCRHTYVRHVA